MRVGSRDKLRESRRHLRNTQTAERAVDEEENNRSVAAVGAVLAFRGAATISKLASFVRERSPRVH